MNIHLREISLIYIIQRRCQLPECGDKNCFANPVYSEMSTQDTRSGGRLGGVA